MHQAIRTFKDILEKADKMRDEVLFLFIKPFWPRIITPNRLTYVRILIGTYLAALLFYFHLTSHALIVVLFCAGAVTDMLDGSVARGLRLETDLGAMLDSFADRILILPIGIYSLIGTHPRLLATILVFELVNLTVSWYARARRMPAESNIFGKIKMVLQSIVFAGLLIFWNQPPNLFFVITLWISVAFLIWSIQVKLQEIFSYGKSKNL
jgi:CDP-diacylglycerol--glycerol-3-phosphate 3-phosphatidyltransferase